MSTFGPPKPRVLCLDGGGIRGLSEILILKELMLQVRIHRNLDYTPEPNQCFDFICGTSTGGLLAVLLGRLGKTLDECEDLFRSFGSRIFAGGSVVKALRMISTGSKHTSKGLSEVVFSQAGTREMYEVDALLDGHVPVAVIAVSKTTRDDYLFRTYGARASVERCSVVEACLATSAATTFFPSITIKGVEYVDGAFRKNNPTSAALAELESEEWPRPLQNAVADVGCIVSVGTGRSTFGRETSNSMAALVPKGLISLKDAAKLCIKIATDCHEAHLEVENRFRKAGKSDHYHRFDVEIGLESVVLNESDDKALQHITSVTKGYLKSCQHEMKLCAQGIEPRSSFGATDVTMNRPPIPMFSSLPERTDTFFGREEQLSDLQKLLDPSQPGRKTSLVCGIGGSGKTQLALRHIHQKGGRYSAIIWVNASTRAHAANSFTEAASEIRRHWPDDVPVFRTQYDDDDAVEQVKSRLRCTRHRNWLLVIDSADDPDQDDLARYMPCCEFGSILVTSTRLRACHGFRPRNPISLGGLDDRSSYALLLTSAGMTDNVQELDSAKKIVDELSGIPLAIEQAGGLIRNGEFTFPQFLASYKSNYRSLMDYSLDEGLWSYEKNRVIVTVLDMTYRLLDKYPHHVTLLNFIGVLGSWQIPISLMEGFELYKPIADGFNTQPDDIDGLRSMLRDPHLLRLALRRLASFCLIRLKEENGHIVSFMVHRLLCQWSLENVTTRNRQEYILQSAYGLAKAACRSEPDGGVRTADLGLGDGSHTVYRQFLTPFKQRLSLISQYVAETDLDPCHGRFRALYALIVCQAAWAHLAQGHAEEAKRFFQLAISYETVKFSQAGREWPNDETALRVMCGFSRACYKSGDLCLAIESLESIIPLSGGIHGHESEITRNLVSRLRHICERRDVMQQHQKAALLASTATQRDATSSKEARSRTPPQQTRDQTEGRRSEDQSEDGMYGNELNEECRQDPVGNLVHASHAGDILMIQLLLGIPNFYPDGTDIRGKTPLLAAAEGGHACVVGMLLAKGADVELRDAHGWTPLTVAAHNGLAAVMRLLLDHGADVEASADFGRGHTPLFFAATYGHVECVSMLLQRGADPRRLDDEKASLLFRATEKDRDRVVELLLGFGLDANARDFLGRTLLHCAARRKACRTLRLLLKSSRGMDVNAQGVNGETALHEACRWNDTNLIWPLVFAGARCDIRDGNGRTPHDIATIRRRDQTLRVLAMAKGYPQIVPFRGGKTLVEAVISEPLDVVTKMLRGIAPEELNASSALDGTALHQACVHGREDVVEALLLAGADPDRANCLGQTPLFEAVTRKLTRGVRALVARGADANKAPFSKPTLWEYAWDLGRREICMVLLEHGAAVEKSFYAQCALKKAAATGNVGVCERLVAAGALPRLRLGGNSAMDHARREGSSAVLDFFETLDDAGACGRSSRERMRGAVVVDAYFDGKDGDAAPAYRVSLADGARM